MPSILLTALLSTATQQTTTTLTHLLYSPLLLQPLLTLHFHLLTLPGPTEQKLLPIVGQAMPVLIGCLSDPTAMVRYVMLCHVPRLSFSLLKVIDSLCWWPVSWDHNCYIMCVLLGHIELYLILCHPSRPHCKAVTTHLIFRI